MITYSCHGLTKSGRACPCILEIDVPDGLDDEEIDEHIVDIAEAVHDWYRGLYCPQCAGDVIKEQEADDARDDWED